ncbi:hypothetical protein GCM10023092_14240 [Rurimicrobium arvi]|uniref:DUF403 domain-containing protein n=2 Tax=Rurimicrobium arvi TaxID=2049916 RepID=A0ABP8MP96_9BACT
MNEQALRKNINVLKTLVSICLGYRHYGRQLMDQRITLVRLMDFRDEVMQLWGACTRHTLTLKEADHQLRMLEKRLGIMGSRIGNLLEACWSVPEQGRRAVSIIRSLRDQYALNGASAGELLPDEVYRTVYSDKTVAFAALIQLVSSEHNYQGKNDLALSELQAFYGSLLRAREQRAAAELACRQSNSALTNLLTHPYSGLRVTLAEVKRYMSSVDNLPDTIRERMAKLEAVPL